MKSPFFKSLVKSAEVKMPSAKMGAMPKMPSAKNMMPMIPKGSMPIPASHPTMHTSKM